MTIPNIHDLPMYSKVVVSNPDSMFLGMHGFVTFSIILLNERLRKYHVRSEFVISHLGAHREDELTPYRLLTVTDKASPTLHVIPQ